MLDYVFWVLKIAAVFVVFMAALLWVESKKRRKRYFGVPSHNRQNTDG